ncbi:unnamed protein product, partial [Laminaria digitata]
GRGIHLFEPGICGGALPSLRILGSGVPTFFCPVSHCAGTHLALHRARHIGNTGGGTVRVQGGLRLLGAGSRGRVVRTPRSL